MAEEQASTGTPVGIFATPELAAARLKMDEVAARRTSTVTYVSAGHCLVIGEPEAALRAVDRLLDAGVESAAGVFIDPGVGRVNKALTDRGVALFTVPELSVSGHLGAFVAQGGAGEGTMDLAVSMQRPSGRFDLVLDLSPVPVIAARLSPPGYVHVRSTMRARASDSGSKDSSAGTTSDTASGMPSGTSTLTAPEAAFGGATDSTADSTPGSTLDSANEAANEAATAAAIDALAGLVGEFDKPRYFAYDASICAHSRSRLPGCSNCLDVCVTGAITSAGEGVDIDPFLCQGCGSCATRCPTGAMVYAYPKPSDAIRRTREALVPGASGDRATTLLLHGEEAAAAVEAARPESHGVLPMLVEEVSAFGIDYWATILCAGVGRILLVSDAAEDDPNRHALEEQAGLLRTLVSGLGVGPEVIQLIRSSALADLSALPAPAAALTTLNTPAFAAHDDKRQTVRTALDALAKGLGFASGVGNVTGEVALVPLLPGSPFGQIRVDTDACTLCVACVSTCPAGALLDGQDTPALRMVEANCVQCGLCEAACPENAISLEPRFLRDSVEARRVRTLHEESPFDCITCHKAFATKGMIETMLGKLSGHWMFEDEKALRRLKMCEDCRVKDIFRDGENTIDVHAKP